MATAAPAAPPIAHPVSLLDALPDADADADAVAADAARARAALHAAVRRGRPERAAGGVVQTRPGQVLTPKDPREAEAPVPEGVVLEEVEVLADEGDPLAWVPLSVARPAGRGERRPALLWLHATGQDRASLRRRLLAAAARGYVAAAPDARHHGGRLLGDGEAREEYQGALVRALRGHTPARPFLLDNVWDLGRVLDYLSSRPDVDASRIGVTGISLGGMHAWLLAAADDRVTVAAPALGVQSFAWAAAHDAWHARAASLPLLFDAAAADAGLPAPDAAAFARALDAVAPGLRTEFDAPLSLACIAPRPLLIANGADDARCPMPGVALAAVRAARVYEAAGAGEALRLHAEPGVGHCMAPALGRAVDEWLDAHLLPR